MLAINSPGGVVTGVPEAAAAIAQLATIKPVVAVTDSQSASAAYWIASQATENWLTPSAEIGSIGVYSALVDESAAWAKDGYKLELMKAGAHKAAGIPGLPLSAEDRALMQASVDSIYAEFTAAVAARRPRMNQSRMQGQMFRGAAAVEAGLADLVVPSLAAALADFEGD